MSDTYIPIDWLASSARLGGREIIVDGINANRCNTGLGSALRLWGVRPPTAAQLAAMTTVAGTGGSMTAGEHIVAVTFAVTTPITPDKPNLNRSGSGWILRLWRNRNKDRCWRIPLHGCIVNN